LQGRWSRLHRALHAAVPLKAGRNPQLCATIIDSQSVKTGIVGGPRGYDGGKKANGRKRHLLVGTQGLIMRAVVHPANIADWEGRQAAVGASARPVVTLAAYLG
jgi:putative transposase